MNKWAIDYKHFHLEDSWHETEHDAEADTAHAALVDFLLLYNGDDVISLERCQDEMTLEQAASEFFDDGLELAFWQGGADIYRIEAVRQEDTERCPMCAGSGRTVLLV